MLRYLAEHSLAHPPSTVKEYQIATEVFGRSSGFDPQADSTVRVQAGRLRSKLAEYYASEGIDDELLVELPKGSYMLSFHHRSATAARQPLGVAAQPQLLPSAESRPRSWLLPFVVVSILLAVALVTIVVFVVIHRSKASETPAAGVTAPAPAALQTFWKPFVSEEDQPWLVFSNAAFVGRPETGMRYYHAGSDSQDTIWDHYTGVGEVLAVHNLDQMFATLHRPLRVKRGSLFSLDDLKSNDLIFVGSPSENLTLRDIPGSKEFIFQRVSSGPRKGDLAVVNMHPKLGEPTSFLASPSGSPLTEDYAVIALMPGLNPAHSEMILAGTTTFGTQGAAEFVCRQSSVADLLSRLSLSNTGEIKPFEALVRVKVTRGVPVATELVTVRDRIE